MGRATHLLTCKTRPNLMVLVPAANSSPDIEKVLADVNDRFTMVAYSDASFAVGETKQSISVWIHYSYQ